jgi:hypothetical protein
LSARRPAKAAAIAFANKIGRMAWATMTRRALQSARRTRGLKEGSLKEITSQPTRSLRRSHGSSPTISPANSDSSPMMSFRRKFSLSPPGAEAEEIVRVAFPNRDLINENSIVVPRQPICVVEMLTEAHLFLADRPLDLAPNHNAQLKVDPPK